jgi:hypothetical protein
VAVVVFGLNLTLAALMVLPGDAARTPGAVAGLAYQVTATPRARACRIDLESGLV